ncbi:uncharacterized protein BDR25DRAFT_382014 [Lindgomyces ingoldianus]|uniref:Uncharacterized protein n=1 Tax=Lindgomyces ingoldianus TaxID=673940 RepID=A0ACB6R9N5_9PLEO|nr:uncharacterized protein BDR25DRAFT_382014 [Lindgomyces ingoldianus]KAF2475176.1 hypothetical protein BDR25DRAFT_382014 [Lindgomyces ingoldianus]
MPSQSPTSDVTSSTGDTAFYSARSCAASTPIDKRPIRMVTSPGNRAAYLAAEAVPLVTPASLATVYMAMNAAGQTTFLQVASGGAMTNRPLTALNPAAAPFKPGHLQSSSPDHSFTTSTAAPALTTTNYPATPIQPAKYHNPTPRSAFVRTKRLDQGPEPSVADVYPEDYYRSPGNVQFGPRDCSAQIRANLPSSPPASWDWRYQMEEDPGAKYGISIGGLGYGTDWFAGAGTVVQ